MGGGRGAISLIFFLFFVQDIQRYVVVLLYLYNHENTAVHHVTISQDITNRYSTEERKGQVSATALSGKSRILYCNSNTWIVLTKKKVKLVMQKVF